MTFQIYPERETEWVAAFVMTGFGFSLLHPDQTFAMVGYRTSIALAGEALTGWLLFAVGLISVVALFVNGRLPRITYTTRLLLSAVRAIIFFMLAFLFGKAFVTDAPANTAAATYLVMGWLDSRNMLKISAQGKLVERFNNAASRRGF